MVAKFDEKQDPLEDIKVSEEGKQGVTIQVTDDVIADVTGAVGWEDPNLDKDMLVLEDDSPYPEVRAAVANTDDPEMPASTLRAWVIGILFAIVVPGLNQFFFFRFPSITIQTIAAQLLIFPIGRLWSATIPNKKVFGIHLNPGTYSVKEHVYVEIINNISRPSAYATDIIAVQRVYYNQSWNFSYQWLIVMSTQLMGFSIGGIARRFLVSPPSMIWPANLVSCALFNTLHSQYFAGQGNRGGISRERFFFYAFLASFFWYFLPGYLMGFLSYFAWVTWIFPNSATIGALFGYHRGMGMSVITFDWAQIAYIGSPLATPWWAEANIFTGFVAIFWIIAPAIYFTNTWYSSYFPISSSGSYDNTGAPYNVSKILTENSVLDIQKYKEYSPLFLSTTFALSYAVSFASITATIVHTFLYFRKQIWVQARRSLNEQPDIHARLMSRYTQVPEWWYAIIFITMFVFGVVAIEVWPTQMPVWGFILALIISFIYTIPIGMIQAITNQQVGLNVITELIIGYALPGRPIAMMLFKTWGYITMVQALSFTSDFKLGHYMKIPPRSMFWGQVVATVLAGTTQLGVQAWMFSNIKDMCTPTQKDGFFCLSTEVFGTASIIWGVIGPARQFSSGQIYYSLVFFFLVGAFMPVVPWLITRKYPSSFARYINFPVILSGTGLIPPATAINYVPWALVGFVFQYVIRRRHFSWWAKYNYVLSAALDSGVAISTIVIFFALQYPQNGQIGLNTIQAWWGNAGFQKTAEYDPARVAIKSVPQGQKFGPSTW
ncbi:OPT oligopeptide transporter [Hysterangium stoloniferum]|nr:OPT oligopeptide transporter [Hysterangium stoloniferum]